MFSYCPRGAGEKGRRDRHSGGEFTEGHANCVSRSVCSPAGAQSFPASLSINRDSFKNLFQEPLQRSCNPGCYKPKGAEESVCPSAAGEAVPGQDQGLWGSHSRPASKQVRCSWCCSSECTYKLSLFNKQHECFPGPHAELYSKYICTNINF